MTVQEASPLAVFPDLENFHVVDVRGADEFNGPLGHIAKAELLPLPDVLGHAARLAPLEPLLLVCRSGRRSLEACRSLQAHGIEKVTNLAGGMIAWNEAGLPVAPGPTAETIK